MRERGIWVVLAVVAVAAVMWLLPETEHDLSQRPQEAAYPRLKSDDLPKKPILPPTEPFANGWAEPSPAAIVEQDAQRAAREILERQQREMMGNN